MPQSKLYIVPREPVHRSQTPNNLRAQPTPLVGRDREVEAVCRLLGDTRTKTQLLTLVGPGGTGKTRLAEQVAEEMLDEFEDGVYFVELAPITDPELVVPAILGMLQPGITGDGATFAALQEYLQGKRVLLVLDNFEQVLPAARMLADLLASCPDLTLLVTTRSTLRLRGEREFMVPPLDLPDPSPGPGGQRPGIDKLLQYGAVALFQARAKEVKPDFALTAANAETVVEVCRRVDALPLGIELVAAYARLLTPQAILARLTQPLQLLAGGALDAPVRHQTMRDTIAWSYNLLGEEEQRLFRELSVFVGTFALQAAEAVCNKGSDIAIKSDHPLAIEVVKGLYALMEKSLLRQQAIEENQEPRLTMLETVREYALEQLEASGEAEVMRRRHADFYLSLAQRIEITVGSGDVSRSGELSTWMSRLRLEHDNLRATLTWLLETGEPTDYEAALRLILDLRDFWERNYHTSEVQQWLETALAKSKRQPTPLRLKALRYASILASRRADYSRAQAWIDEALAAARELGDKTLMPPILNLVGLLAAFQGKYEQARTVLEEALDICRRSGNESGMGEVYIYLGEMARYQGDYAQAEAYQRESLGLFRTLGDKVRVLQALTNLGHTVYHQGDLPRARAAFMEALALVHEIDTRKVNPEVLTGLSSVIIAESVGIQRPGTRDQGSGARRSSEPAPGPRSLVPPTQAVQVLGLASAIVERSGTQMEPIDQAEFDCNVAAARSVLGDAAFSAAWEEGRNMTLDQAIELALQTGTLKSGSGSEGGASEARGRVKTSLPGGLTPREYEVVGLVAQGLSNEEIARRLVLSERTVEMHVSNALQKLGLTTRTQLAAWAVQQGLAQGPTPPALQRSLRPKG